MEKIQRILLFFMFFLSLRLCEARSCVDDVAIYSDDTSDFTHGLVDFCNKNVKKLLDKVNKGKVEIGLKQYHVTPLDKEYVYLEQEACKGLMYLNIPDYSDVKIPILNVHCKEKLDRQNNGAACCYGMTLHRGPYPYAILLNLNKLKTKNTNGIKFDLFHQLGHFWLLVNEYILKPVNPSCSAFFAQNREELADLISLMILCKQYINDDGKNYDKQHERIYPWLHFLNDIWQWASKVERPKGSLQSKELIYYAKLTFSVMDSINKKKINSDCFETDFKIIFDHYRDAKACHTRSIGKEISSIIQSLKDIESLKKSVTHVKPL